MERADLASEPVKTIEKAPAEPRTTALARERKRPFPGYLLFAPVELLGVAALAYLNLGSGGPVASRAVISALYGLTVVLALRIISRRQSLRLVAGGTPLFIVGALLFAAGAVSAALYWMPTVHPGAHALILLTLESVCILLPGQLMLAEIRPANRALVLGRDGVTELLETLEERHPRDVSIVGIWADGVIELLEPELSVERCSLQRALSMLEPDLVVVAAIQGRSEIYEVLVNGGHRGFRAFGVPELYEHWFGKVPVRALGDAWFMSMLHLYHRPYSRIAKRLLDVVIATAALLLTLPAFAIVAGIVATTGRPIIYRQTRIGEYGKAFTIFKFRTMRRDAENDGAAWAIPRDPRATAVGRWLRRSRLDELPQLWNVLRGDMSVVGPRPERPEFMERLERDVPHWTKRHLLKPGITGWAQVCHSYAADERETEAKLSYDLWYLRHQGLLVDVLICLRTIPRMFFGAGSR